MIRDVRITCHRSMWCPEYGFFYQYIYLSFSIGLQWEITKSIRYVRGSRREKEFHTFCSGLQRRELFLSISILPIVCKDVRKSNVSCVNQNRLLNPISQPAACTELKVPVSTHVIFTIPTFCTVSKTEFSGFYKIINTIWVESKTLIYCLSVLPSEYFPNTRVFRFDAKYN